MFLITLGIAINLYIFEPLSCVSKIFCWPGLSEMINKKTEGEHANPKHTEAVVNAVSEVIKNLDVQKEGEFNITSNINSNNNNSSEDNNGVTTTTIVNEAD